MSYFTYISKDGFIETCDIFGNPVTKTQADYPYSYDPYLIRGNPIEDREGVEFVYSDRIEKLHFCKYSENENIKFVEEALTEACREPIKVLAIAKGANQATGYPYYVYAFKRSQNEEN